MSFWSKKIVHGIDNLVDNIEIVGLYRRWLQASKLNGIALASVFLQLKPDGWADASGEPLADKCMLLRVLNESVSDLQYLHYGAAIARHSRFDMTGKLVSDFGGELRDFFLSCYQDSFAQQRPIYTVHHAERAANVFTWERLVLPLEAPSGERFALVYNQPMESRHLLLDSVLNAASEGILAVRALWDQPEAPPSLAEESAPPTVRPPTDWLVLVVNAPARQLLGITDENPVGRRAIEVIPSWLTLELNQRATEGLLAPGGIDFELSYPPPSTMVQRGVLHTTIHCQGQTASMGQDSCVLRLTNVSDRKLVESLLVDAKSRAEEGARAKSTFLATMSHEIRTPMNGVIGMTSLLLDSPLTAEQREYAETIRQSGESLLVIINDILDFSKIESGQLRLDPAPFHLIECVESAIDVVGPMAQDKGVDLLCDVSSDLPDAVTGDVQRIRQILVNLVGNAVKFSPAGQVLIRVTRGMEPALNGQPAWPALRFEVHDQGVGISESDQQKLFAPFVQVSSVAREAGGTGLGLAISRRLVDAMEGHMGVRSTIGVGSMFYFTIPFQASYLPSAAVRAHQYLMPAHLHAKLHDRHVLVTSHSADTRRVMAQMLRGWGMRVTVCQGMAHTLETLTQAIAFDALVLASDSSSDGGLALAQGVVLRRPGLPMILIGPKTQWPHQGRAMFHQTLSSPVRRHTLYSAVARCLGFDPATQGRHALRQLFDPKLAGRHPLQILLVEDHDVNRAVATKMLAGFGYRCDVAHDGVEALQALQRQRYDLIFMDIEMGRMDGLTATRQIIAETPPDLCPRIVGMSAHALPEHREAAMSAGMHDYITKPITPANLRGALVTAYLKRTGFHDGSTLPPSTIPGESLHSLSTGSPRTGPDSRDHGIDLAQFNALRNLDDDGSLMRGLLQSLKTHAPDTISAMRGALDAQDAAALSALAHQIKGVAANLGASRLSVCAADVDGLARAGQLAQAAGAVESLSLEFEQSVLNLESLLH